jgi:transcription antitermination factor NusG
MAEVNWYGIAVHSLKEARVAQEFTLRDIEHYLPVRKVKRRWSDRVKVCDVPLFPGYVFGHFDVAEKLRVLNCPGVKQIVGAGHVPLPIEELEIESIRLLTRSNLVLTPWPYLKAGELVRIERGPLVGLEGVVVRAGEGSLRVVVSVTLLQRSVAAEIEREWITHVRSAAAS